MATMGPIAGVAFVRVNGGQLQLRGSLKVSGAGVNATGVAGQDGVHGYTEKPQVPKIEAEFSDGNSVSVTGLQGIRGATVTAELSNGKTYVLAQAWTEGDVSLDASDGKYTVTFGGMSIQEIIT